MSRNSEIRAARLNGATLEEIAKQHRISRERVRQIVLPRPAYRHGDSTPVVVSPHQEPEIINITSSVLRRKDFNPSRHDLDAAICAWFARLNGGENDVAIFKCRSHLYVGPALDGGKPSVEVCLATLEDYPQQLVTDGFSI